MRVLFINPPWVKRKGNVWNNVASIMPPMGLAWMAAVLEEEGHAVEIFDAHAERVDMDRMRIRLIEKGRFDMVGITATTPLITNAREIARIIRREFPSTRIVLGGVHPTVLPEEVLEEEAVDLVVRGEGEKTIKELAAEMPLEEIKGVSYRTSEGIRHNPERELISDLDSLPRAAWHLLPIDKYYPAAGAAKRLPAVSMLSTRGCPGRCTFCYRIFGKKIRVRSGRKVAEEVKYLQENFGIREICFYDDTFTVSHKEVRAFCQGLVDLGVDITWSCFSRVDTINEDLMRTIKSHGCHQISYGLESANPGILANVNKRANNDKAREAIRLAKKFGVDARVAFMLGNPGETIETMEESLKFAIELDPAIAIFNITTPFPGTEMFEWARANGYLTTLDWDEYDFANPVMELPTVSMDEIKEFYGKVYRKFFLRPAYLARRVARLRNVVNVIDSYRAVKAVFST
ncbi:MAG: cobalamin-dependent protein [Sedimentisphaerales bacterium]|nr:cobalamin-dependent protein [Sedimentisphaerales bacterium]